MNEFLNLTKDNFLSYCQENGAIIKDNKELNLNIIKYDKKLSNMDNENIPKCRGIITDSGSNIICFPPIKSIDLNTFLNKYPLEECSIEEFVDGTMINLFYYMDNWHISTRSNIGAKCRWYSKKHFSELFEEANYINYDNLDESLFYTFVLQHPENRIVKEYTKPNIVLVSVGYINNDNLEYKNIYELNESLNVNVPEKYTFSSVEEILNFIEKRDFNFQGVVIKNGINRTKIRNQNYNYVKNLRGNNKNIKYLYFSLRQNMFLSEYLRFFPEYTELFDDFNKDYNNLIDTIFDNYQNYHVKKIITIKQMPFHVRPFCYELHGEYLAHKKHINHLKVLNYMNSLDSARIVFALNPKNH